VAGDERQAIGELGGELIRHDVICATQREKSGPVSLASTEDRAINHSGIIATTIALLLIVLAWKILLGSEPNPQRNKFNPRTYSNMTKSALCRWYRIKNPNRGAESEESGASNINEHSY
jgi:hypothetical protein